MRSDMKQALLALAVTVAGLSAMDYAMLREPPVMKLASARPAGVTAPIERELESSGGDPLCLSNSSPNVAERPASSGHGCVMTPACPYKNVSNICRADAVAISTGRPAERR